MARAPASVKKFRRIEYALRDCVTAQRKLRAEVKAALESTGRPQAETAGLTAIRDGVGPLMNMTRELHAKLFDITDHA